MAVGHYDSDGRLVVYIQRGELSPPRRARYNRRDYWALVALGVLADSEEELYPITCFTFEADLLPAIRRVLQHRGAPFELLEQQEAQDRVAEVIAQQARALNPITDFAPPQTPRHSGS